MKIRAFVYFVVLLLVGLVMLAGGRARAQGILPANNGTLTLGQTLVGVPEVSWYKVQESLTTLTAKASGVGFGVALVEDTGNGHGTLPAVDFVPSVTANCNNCWLGVQFYAQTEGAASGSLTLTWSGSESGSVGPETVALQGQATASSGVVVSPTEWDFGSVAVHSSTAPVGVVVTNLVASLSVVTVESVSVSGDFVLMNGGTAGCAGALEPAAGCVVTVSFAPSVTGQRDGVLTVVTSGGTATAMLAGMGTADPGVALNPVALNFAAGATRLTVAVKNTGSTSVSIGAVTASDPGFSVSSVCSTLAAGASCSVDVGYVPQDGVVVGTMSIPVTMGGVTTPYTVALNGNDTAEDAGLEVVPGDVNFGAAATGTIGGSRVITVNNLTNKTLGLSFTMPREFPAASVEPCATLEAMGSCSVSVGFVPVTGGPLTGTVTVEGVPMDGSANVQGMGFLQGYGTPGGTMVITGYAIPNTPVGFGQVTSGKSATQVLTLTNKGAGTLTVRRITSEPPFLSTGTCGGEMRVGESCSVTLTYAPVYEVTTTVGVGPRTDVGTMTIESDAVSSPDEVEMTGVALPVAAGAASGSAGAREFVLSESSLTFANTQVGDVSDAQVVTLTNSGAVTLHVMSEMVSGTASGDFGVSSGCGTVAVGAGCSFSVTFTPTTASSSMGRSGTLEILSDAGTSLEFVSLVGVSTPAALELNPVELNFGSVNVGAKGSLSVSVSNTGTVPVTFLGLTANGDYAVDGGSCPAVGATLSAGLGCVFTVTFKPTAVGARSGTLSLANGASQLPLTVSLNGVGVAGVLTVTPGALAFGSIDVGYSGKLTVALLNTGNASVSGIVNTVGGANPEEFAVTIPCPVTTLAPNQGCTETVEFAPSGVGASAATLSVASSDTAGPAVVALNGTGALGGSFTLSVNGASSASETVASGSPGSYALLLTPANGFTGNVALTCAPITAGANMSCSLLSSTLTLGTAAMSSTATINTITSESGVGVGVLAGLLLVPLLGLRRRRGLYANLVGCGLVGLAGCGGGGLVVSTVRTTPPGTYQYQVTASSTGGNVVTSSVMLTLVVQ
jgi:hypothetical protein